MAENYIYAVARVRTRELSLLNENVMAQLSAAASEQDCLRILNEKGWGGSGVSTEEMFAAENRKTWAFIREILPKEGQMKVFDVFRLANDYHNLKAAVKEACIDGTHPGIYGEDGTVPASLIARALADSDYEHLPGHMQAVAQEAKELLLKTQDGQLCDITIDRAALTAIREAGIASKEKLLEEYGELTCATGDIKIAVRAQRTGKNKAFLDRALAPSRTIDIRELGDAAVMGFDAILACLSRSIYSDAVEELKKSLASFERWCDNRMIRQIRPEIHNPFGIGPLAAYILARDVEIKTVRIILAGKRNGLPDEMLRERVRETYV